MTRMIGCYNRLRYLAALATVLPILLSIAPIAYAQVQENTTTSSPQSSSDPSFTFTPRWMPVEQIEPHKVKVLFADCLPGEYAISGQQSLQNPNLRVIESSAVPMQSDGGDVSWLYAVRNVDDREHGVKVGTVCAGDANNVAAAENKNHPYFFKPELHRGINKILNDVVVIDDGDGSGDIDISEKIEQTIKIKQTINNFVTQVNNNGGNPVTVIQNLAAKSDSGDIQQKAQVLQFIEQGVQNTPEYQDTVKDLTAQSKTGNGTITLPEASPSMEKQVEQFQNQTESDNITSQQQPEKEPATAAPRNSTAADNKQPDVFGPSEGFPRNKGSEPSTADKPATEVPDTTTPDNSNPDDETEDDARDTSGGTRNVPETADSDNQEAQRDDNEAESEEREETGSDESESGESSEDSDSSDRDSDDT